MALSKLQSMLRVEPAVGPQKTTRFLSQREVQSRLPVHSGPQRADS